MGLAAVKLREASTCYLVYDRWRGDLTAGETVFDGSSLAMDVDHDAPPVALVGCGAAWPRLIRLLFGSTFATPEGGSLASQTGRSPDGGAS